MENMKEILMESARCDLEDMALGYELCTEENVGDFSSDELIEMILEAEK